MFNYGKCKDKMSQSIISESLRVHVKDYNMQMRSITRNSECQETIKWSELYHLSLLQGKLYAYQVINLICILQFLIDSYVSDEKSWSSKRTILCADVSFFMFRNLFWILVPYTFWTFLNIIEKLFHYYYYCPESAWSQNWKNSI